MKVVFILAILLGSYSCFAQNDPNAIVGKWLKIPKEDMIIEVYKAGDEFEGKMVWTKIKDQNKANGFVILDKLKYNAKTDKWEDGKIHDPRSGKTYTASVRIKPDGLLEVNGYIGIKLFGVKKNFKRVK